jgi:polyisoprenoid-binding protein YceI
VTDQHASDPSGGLYESPESGTWIIDPVHSFVTFSVLHMAVSFARGMAAGPFGVITVGRDLLDSRVEAHIDASTLTTLNPLRDSKVLGPDLLDVSNFATIDFVSTRLWTSGENFYELSGDLTIHGVTKNVSLDLILNGVVLDTWGNRRLGITATTELSRDDFGVGEWGHVPLRAGGFMVPSRVKVTLDIEATKEAESAEELAG